MKDAALNALGTKVAGSNYQLVTRYYDVTPAPILSVAISEFGAFAANPGDPKPFLQKIQDAADTYWASQK